MTSVISLNRIRMATITTVDVGAAARLYNQWLDYEIVETGLVEATLASAWGAPAMTGRAYATLEPQDASGTFIRFVAAEQVPNYRPLSTWGWNAIEILIRDPDELHRRLSDSPFLIIGKPEPLYNFPTIVAFQVRGPSSEILYLTADIAPAPARFLPPPGAPVSRPFIMVVAGADAFEVARWYNAKFGLSIPDPEGAAISAILHAQALSPAHQFPITFSQIGDAGHFIEIDGYPQSTGPRPRHHGQLPPGVASACFEVTNLDLLELNYIIPPAVFAHKGYDGRRMACAVGPAGELIELVEAGVTT